MLEKFANVKICRLYHHPRKDIFRRRQTANNLDALRTEDFAEGVKKTIRKAIFGDRREKELLQWCK